MSSRLWRDSSSCEMPRSPSALGTPCWRGRTEQQHRRLALLVVNGKWRRIAGNEQLLHRVPICEDRANERCRSRVLLRDLFDAALADARPATCLAPYIDGLQPPKGRTIVIGAGKASAAMAKAVEDQWRHPIEGLVVTRYGYGEACRRIEIVEAAHPVPEREGPCRGRRILERVKGHTPDDLVPA